MTRDPKFQLEIDDIQGGKRRSGKPIVRVVVLRAFRALSTGWAPFIHRCVSAAFALGFLVYRTHRITKTDWIGSDVFTLKTTANG